VRNPNSFLTGFFSLLPLLRSLSLLRPQENRVPTAAGERNGAAPRALAGARVLRWWSAPPSRVFERGARARFLGGGGAVLEFDYGIGKTKNSRSFLCL
jgi:hypothetical protein